MKKIIVMTMMLFACISYAAAQQQAEIKFDKVTHDFGTFSEESSVQSCTFSFTNVGTAPLVINQAIASCGCTVLSLASTPMTFNPNTL